MKLLGWMHRKFRQNSPEPFKDLIIGNSYDDEHSYQKANFGNYKHVKQSQVKEQNVIRKTLGGVEEDEYEVDEASGGMYELFHGFLAIGTLGSEQVVSDPYTTPTFAISVENITEKEDEVTENELKLINDELEKVLGADDESSSSSSSCGRNSHVSNGRSSHGSIITLSGKPLLEGTESNGNAVLCPLQGYLFGSAIELSETTKTVAKNRTSLGELFQRTKLTEDTFPSKDDNKRTEREGAINLMKKKLKKKMLHNSSRTSTSTTAAPVDSASADKKLHKILHMFHRKVHPENPTGGQKSEKYQKNENINNKKKRMDEGGENKSEWVHPEEDIMIHPKTALNIGQYKTQTNPLHFMLHCQVSSENKEHWIKTDADYLVLEL